MTYLVLHSVVGGFAFHIQRLHPNSNNANTNANAVESCLNIGKPSTLVYNSLLKLYAQTLKNSPILLPRILDTVKRMKEMAAVFPGMEPDSATYSRVIMACSLAPNDEQSKKKAMDLATNTYNHLKDNTSTPELTDMCIHYMLRCLLSHNKEGKTDADDDADDDDDGKDRIEKAEELFSEGCKLGLVNYFVLQSFKSAVPSNRFKEIVGNGRLPDQWIANVTTKKVFYTDGTTGGAGKNARRKGKSTSGWLRKQKLMEAKKQKRQGN